MQHKNQNKITLTQLWFMHRIVLISSTIPIFTEFVQIELDKNQRKP